VRRPTEGVPGGGMAEWGHGLETWEAEETEADACTISLACVREGEREPCLVLAP